MLKKKIRYYLKKILIFVVSVFVLSLVVFWISRLTPVDPLQSYYGERTEKMSSEEKEAARERLGLNEPIAVQYVKWVSNAFSGDFGISYKYKQDALVVIEGRICNTLILGGIGFVLVFVGSLLLGILCAWFEERWIDKILCKVGTIISCVPEFWLSLFLILVFCVNLKILPSSGAYTIGNDGDVMDRIVHLILPLSVVVLGHLWYYAYMVRNKLLEEVREDYVILARVKGLSKRKIMFGHCLRNVMPAYISIMAISVPHIIGGTYIVETVFSYPGLGTLTCESARYADYNLLMLLCIMTGIVVIFFNMIGQIINEQIDPALKTSPSIGDESSEKEVSKEAVWEEKKAERLSLAPACREAGYGSEEANIDKTEVKKEEEDKIKTDPGDDGLFKIAGIKAQETVRIKKHRKAGNIPYVSIIVLGIMLLGCIFAGLITTKDPSYLDLLNYNKAPCSEFLFGTDSLGRDIFSCIWYGGRISIFIGIFSTVISTVIAVIYGTISAISPKWLDTVLMRFTEIFLSIPGLLLIIFIQAILGKPNVVSLSVVIGLTSWPSIAKVVHTEVLKLKNSEYIAASKCMGGGFFHILVRHLTPNFIASIMFMVVMNIRNAIVSESTLSFMGIGLPIEVISLGSMLSLAENALLTSSWWIILIPGIFLVIFLVCITEIGNWLRGKISKKENNLF